MSGQITIRDALPSDKGAIAVMIRQLNGHENSISPDRNLTPSAGEDQYDYAVALVEDQGGFILVADNAGAQVGFIIGYKEEEEGHYIDPTKSSFGYIIDVYVDEACRGKGLAKRMLNEAEKRFKAMGLNRMDLFVLAGNEGAVSVYKNQGFQIQDFAMRKMI